MKIVDWFRDAIIRWLRLEEFIATKQFIRTSPFVDPQDKMITGSDLKIEWIKTDEQFAKLVKFAESFEHKVVRSTSPLLAIKKHGQWVGYAQINVTPVVFTAWHTDRAICSPRDVVEGFKILAGWAKVQHGGGFTSVPLDTVSFLPHVMKKLGFTRCNCELYETTAE